MFVCSFTAVDHVAVCLHAGVSWLPGLPSQALQALGEVLDVPCFNRLLGACLSQPGAGLSW
jgi:hypothetical protein